MEEAGIRAAKREERGLIYYLISNSIGHGDFLLPRVGEEIKKLIDKGKFFVAAEGRNVVGCVSLEEYGGVAELRSLVVKKNWREQGIGKKLISRVANLAKERKYKTLYAFADEELVGLYEELGFEDKGKFIGKDGRALDINGETSQKMKRYCQGCERLKVCTEHLMYKQLS